MGNLNSSIKRILSNRNTVTILGVLLGIFVLYFAYNWRVKQAIKPITVPVAKQAINSSTTVTEEMIGYVDISQNLLSKSPGIITNVYDIVGKKIAPGKAVSVNGLFYTSMLAENSEVDSLFADIEDGYTVYTLEVDLNTTYGNSIYPGNYIDLYLKGEDENDRLIYGKFIESIKVLDVEDSEGNSVFSGTNSKDQQPAVLLFAVPDDMFKLLRKAELIGMEIYPVPRNLSYTKNPKATEVKSTYLTNFILANSSTIPDEDLNN